MQTESKLGILYTASAYILWGILPIYWKFIQEIPAFEILAHRIIWSCLFMFGVIVILRKREPFKQECKRIFTNKRQVIGISLASITISINWVTYIWAVNTDHVVEASLGYYINPLVSIFLGMLVLKESFNKAQWLAILLATIGVTYMTWNFGSFPWIAILLAFSFGSYGLLKKMVNVGAVFGLTIETLLVTPIALLYLFSQQAGNFEGVEWISMTTIYVFGAGIVTAIPLLLFSSGAKRIPLSLVGFLQYFAPTIMLIIGVFLYNEPFTHVHMIAFSFIWSGLAIYTLTRLKRPRTLAQ
ncbi:transporter [Pontibacillus chungwhensis BH030062]|uniref:Transporter n=1 Tax=Pontibacillus chungwhensis BH030062 TaxID=1385513 RepID=A0A0A2URL1_9BACI|nr:EamA family transporter RarD [Pontibacillus chungwhensis]KGP90584.1 transporter [Pontibacillus chungwhensis BH030062]